MKTTYLNIIITAIFSIVLMGCSSKHSIVVSGAPNTEIYWPSGKKLATLDNKGTAKIDLSANEYHAYLLAKNPQSDILVPFGLDYHKDSYICSKIAEVGGITLSALGITSMLAGTILIVAAEANEDEDISNAGLAMIGYGCAGGVLGVCFGGPAGMRNQQLSYQYKFKYDELQNSNSEITFTNPVINYVNTVNTKKDIDNRVLASNNIATADTITTTQASSKKLSTTSKKTLKNYSKQIEGDYIGSGTLKLDNEVIESYTNIKVCLNRIDNNTVGVRIIESDGTSFFDEDIPYLITKNGDNFDLTCKGIQSATIKIDNDKKMILLHPRIKIEGNIYELYITASLKQ